ncbi:MAG: hypothetical protein PHS53_01185 [Candidatus Pacebacteria bacterium]|nr:hypothetical protein [Candidatus Paceibacterota bacterium]MDD5356746.1 hypothetical protein [Candidatus Paceibacterota bacterium]
MYTSQEILASPWFQKIKWPQTKKELEQKFCDHEIRNAGDLENHLAVFLKHGVLCTTEKPSDRPREANKDAFTTGLHYEDHLKGLRKL